MSIKNVRSFVHAVRRSYAREPFELAHVNMGIETAYEQHIVSVGMNKSDFLRLLAEEDREIFTQTVEHLFTPINWSRVKLRTLWALKNTTTGSLLTLERIQGEDGQRCSQCGTWHGDEVFRLIESSEDPDMLTFAPMLSGSEEDMRTFADMLKQIPPEEPVYLGTESVTLEINEGVNMANVEPVEIRVIF